MERTGRTLPAHAADRSSEAVNLARTRADEIGHKTTKPTLNDIPIDEIRELGEPKKSLPRGFLCWVLLTIVL